MKRKNSDNRTLRWLPRIGIALAFLPFLVPAMMLSFLFGLFYYEDANSTPIDALAGGFTAFVHTPSYTILQQEERAKPAGTLYLAGWTEPTATSCLGVIWVQHNRGIPNSYAFHGSLTECGLERYSIDQFWTGRHWNSYPFSVAYGYSGDAASVVVTWQDKTVTEHNPVNGTYLAIHSERLQVIRSVDFYSVAGSLIYSFPDSKRSRIASGRNGT